MELSNQSNLQRRVNVNTDDIQKVLMQASDDVSTDIHQTQQQSQVKDKVEVRSPIQQIIHGKESDAKKDLLKEFIQKVASTGSDILTSPDKGKKSSSLTSDLKLIFGSEQISKDEVTISASARISQMGQSVSVARPERAKIQEVNVVDEVDRAESEQGLSNHLSTDRNSIRDQIHKLELDSDSISEGNPLDDSQIDAGDAMDAIGEKPSIDEKDKEDDKDDFKVKDDSDGDGAPDRGYADSSQSSRTSNSGPTQARGSRDLDGDSMVEGRDPGFEDKTEESPDLDDDNLIKDIADREENAGGLSRNQRILGLSDEGADQQDNSERQREEDADEDNRVLLNRNSVANQNSNDQDGDGVIDSVDSDQNLDDADEDKEVESGEKTDKDKQDDNEIEAAQGGRIQVGTSTGDSSEDSGQSDQGSDQDDPAEAARIRSSHAQKQESKDDAIEKYTQSLRANLISNKKDLFSQGVQEETLLKQYGVTSRQLKDIQMAVKLSVKEEIRNNIKDAILNKQLSLLNQYDSAAGDARLNKFTDYFVNNLLLGGQDFGNFDEGFQGLINKAMYYASKDLADFAIDELGEFVMNASLDPSKNKGDKIREFEQKVADLNKITNNPKITEEWAQTAMEAMMKNLGLAKEDLQSAKLKTTGLSVDVNSGGGGQQQGKREKHGYEYEEKDEKDIFINRLRALYLQRAVSPGIRTTLDTEFKIRKLKNGLMKMGVYTDVLNEKIQKEAEMVAKDNIMDMLREALEERSTLYELKGAAYSLIENKIKSILKNADKVGISIDKSEFNKLRDESNHRMFEITRKEVEMIGVRLSEMDLPQLVIRHREMQKLLSRLKEESNMQDDLPGDDRLSVMTIVETA